jgi:acetyl-CoA carboxylase biotin carboxylase subunit
MPIKRVLIANRGEIAIRIVRACREAGLESVAVFSDADVSAPHVHAADTAFRIGPAPAADSYLSIPNLIAAAQAAGADAIHPGYGFLSERPEFARACEAAAITFIGPPADVIERMGSKIEARALAEAAGVTVVPGQIPADQSDAGVVAVAGRIGYPILVKASAGGGGKGMRILRAQAGATDLVGAARREAIAAFGDGTLYVERLIERPRHVEIQIFGDARGQIVHLFERECSVQRRHQKIVEESPSPALSEGLRARMCAAAVAAGRAAGYRSAGTVEFLVEGTGDAARFYFLEMNTRLQVEHTVTEAVTGVDLVRAQFAVAAGGPLPWQQESLTQRGHAIECRIYAEDPASGFLPQAGVLAVYREPSGPGIRIDSGVAEGIVVGVNYDPLLAKLIAYGESREAATAKAIAALRAYPILGIRTNIPFLLRLLAHPGFRDGRLHTGFLDDHMESLIAAPVPPPEAFAVAAAASPQAGNAMLDTGLASTTDPWAYLRGWGR